MIKRGLLIICLIIIFSGFVIAESPTKLLLSNDGDSSNGYAVFDGSNDYLEISEHDDFDFGTEYTLEFWALKKGGYRGINIGNYQDSVCRGLLAWDINGNTLSINPNGPTCGRSVHHFQYATPAINEWHHYVFVKNDTNMTFYIDGQWMNSTIFSSTLADSDLVWIGKSNSGDGTPYYFNGYFDEVKFYQERALSDAEVATRYADGRIGVDYSGDEGLVAYYPFDGNFDDMSGSSNVHDASQSGGVVRSGAHSATVYGNPKIQPRYTDDKAIGGTPSASREISPDYTADKAFDDNVATWWQDSDGYFPYWLEYDFGSEKVIKGYSITPYSTYHSSNTYNPYNFRLQGYNGTDWVDIDTETSYTNWVGSVPTYFDVDSPGSYQKYRVYLINNILSSTQTPLIREIEFFEADENFGGMMKFDGSDDRLLAPDNTDWDFGNGEFTIDAWVKTTDDNGGILTASNSGPDSGWQFIIAANKVQFFVPEVISYNAFQDPDVINDGKWHHVAVSRTSSDSIGLFVDGVQKTSYTSSGSVNGVYGLGVGTTYSYGSGYLSGEIDDARIIKGRGINFSIEGVPSFPVVADENTTLLLHFDGDESDSQHSINIESGGQVDFDGAEYVFDGSHRFHGSGYLTVGDSPDWDFGTDDFTIDFWLNLNSMASTSFPLGRGSSGSSRWDATIADDGRIMLTKDGGSSLTTATGVFQTGDWHHIAYVREDGVATVYLDGKNRSSLAFADDMDVGGDLIVGAGIIGTGAIGAPITGYIDELRITNGLARWSGNFTPSSRAYGQPVVSSFSGESTDLSSVDISYVENLVLATSEANVKWNGAVNLDGANLDSYVKINSIFVSIDAKNLDSSLNTSANVTLTLPSCKDLTLYYAADFYDNSDDIITNGQICNGASIPSCEIISCNEGVVTFTAEHFDSYTGSSGAPVPEFSDYALVLAIALTIGGLFFLRRR